MAVNVQKPHEMPALIDPQTRKLRAQLLGAMVRRQAGEPAPQRLHFRRSVEPEQSAERGRVSFLEMLGPLDAEQRHEEERQQRRAQAIEGRTDFTVELAADQGGSKKTKIDSIAILEPRGSTMVCAPSRERDETGAGTIHP